ncbi:MAG: heavy metal RND transporter [Mesorhizobium sp.]|nr:MAG: heavy metal RND transporter [Mesorhizobium sp.]
MSHRDACACIRHCRSQAAKAAQEDYEFQLVENEIKEGGGAIVAVRLLDKRTGAPVANAVVFATRMDMAPDGMEAMSTPVEALPPEEPGIYRFKTNLTMAGGWRFSLAAKVQGETETVERRLEFKAVQ